MGSIYNPAPGTGVGVIKAQRVTTGSIAGASSAAVTLTWAAAFADANYTVTANVVEATAATLALRVHHIESQTASTVVVRVANDTLATALTGTLNVIAIHD